MKQATGEQLGIDKITEKAIEAEEATEKVKEEVYSSMEERAVKKLNQEWRTLGLEVPTVLL